MWAVGCLVYVLLSGMHPFDFGDEEKVINERVRRNAWGFHEEQWGGEAAPSKASRDMLKKMLVADGRQRLTADQALRHPWIVAQAEEMRLDRDMRRTLEELRAFKARRNFKKGVRAIMVSNMVHRMGANSGSSGSGHGSSSSNSNTTGGSEEDGGLRAAEPVAGVAAAAEQPSHWRSSVSPTTGSDGDGGGSPARKKQHSVKHSSVLPEEETEVTLTKG